MEKTICKNNNMVSTAKGVGILLVLIGHFGFVLEVKHFIYLFHMPLFFFLSGYLFKDRTINDLPRYIIKKIKSLYIPFVACNLFAMAFHNALCHIGIYRGEDVFLHINETMGYLVKVLICIKMEDVVAPMWFLPILMVVSVCYCILRLASGNEKVNSVMITALFLFVYMLLWAEKIGGVYRAIILVGAGMWFFHIGHLYRLHEDEVKRYVCGYPVVIGCFILEIILSIFVDVNMIQMRFSNPIVFTIGALMGINIIVSISEKINIGWLQYFGNNSLTILEWHYWGGVLTTLLQATIYKLEIKGIITYMGIKPVWFVVYFLFGLGLPLIILFAKKIVLHKFNDAYVG